MELETWKKLFKGWTISFEGWGEAARWTEERRMASRRCKRTGRHWYLGRKAVLGSIDMYNNDVGQKSDINL